MMSQQELKQRVKDHWEKEVCGSRYVAAANGHLATLFAEVDRRLYELDYMRLCFAGFEDARDKRVLEVGLGMGSDFIRWARGGGRAYGVDLTEASVGLVRSRLDGEHLNAEVMVGDAEQLPFSDYHFDIYYSWGALHHTPSTEKALAEAWRVLTIGGRLKLMLYHYPSVFAGLIWFLYGPIRGRFVSPRRIIFERVESPGTKCFTVDEVRGMLERASHGATLTGGLRIRTYLASPDLLTFQLSQKYNSRIWRALQYAYPRSVIRRVASERLGTFMTVEAVKTG